MNKELIVSSNRYETVAAILEDDLVSEVFVERESQRGSVGNICKGRVSKVLPGMQCAFVDIGLERDAFLYVSDVTDNVEALASVAEDASKQTVGEQPVFALGSPMPEPIRPLEDASLRSPG